MNGNTQAIVLVGPPACGKGEVRKYLSGIGFREIEVSSVIKARIANDPDLKAEAERLMSNGELLPDETINFLIGKHLDMIPMCTPLVIDGSCRSANQTEFLRVELLRHGYEIIFIIFEASYEICKDRVATRVEEMIEAGIPVRPDDTVKVHEGRYRIYEEAIDHVEALLLRKGSHVHFVDASQNKEAVREAVMSHVQVPTFSSGK